MDIPLRALSCICSWNDDGGLRCPNWLSSQSLDIFCLYSVTLFYRYRGPADSHIIRSCRSDKLDSLLHAFEVNTLMTHKLLFIPDQAFQ